VKAKVKRDQRLRKLKRTAKQLKMETAWWEAKLVEMHASKKIKSRGDLVLLMFGIVAGLRMINDKLDEFFDADKGSRGQGTGDGAQVAAAGSLHVQRLMQRLRRRAGHRRRRRHEGVPEVL